MAPTHSARKTKAAYAAMRAIGIEDAETKSVLKELLEVKKRIWADIEAEGYKLLANAILEEQSKHEKDELDQPLSKLCKINLDKVAAGSKGTCSSNASKRRKKCSSADDNNEPQPPSRRRRRNNLDVIPERTKPHSSADEKNGSEQPIKRPRRKCSTVTQQKKWCTSAEQKKDEMYFSDDEEDEPEQPLIRKWKKNLGNTEQTKACSLAMQPAEENHADVLSQVAPGEKSADIAHSTELAANLVIAPLPEKSSKASVLTGPLDNALTIETPRDDIPIAIILPGQSDEWNISNSPSDKLGGLNSLTSHFVEGNGETGVVVSSGETVVGHHAATREGESSALEVVSSPAGDVKLSLNFESQYGKIPSLNDVLNYVQENCLRAYKIMDPNFTTTFLNSFVEGARKLGAGSIEPYQEGVGASDREDPLLPSSAYNASVSFNGIQCLENSEMPQSELTIEKSRILSTKCDITKGNERVEIPWINDVNDEYPQHFFYISQSMAFQRARVDFSLSQIDYIKCSDCDSNCVLSSATCPCATETGCHAYTSEGILRDDFLQECIYMREKSQKKCVIYCEKCPATSQNDMEPCKGHLERKFIKECTFRCSCSKRCGNRVVQQGITRKLQVFYTTEGKGWGLRTLEDLPSGAFVCEYVGEILTCSELLERKAMSPSSMRNVHPVLLDAAWTSISRDIEEEEALCLDATSYGNIARFINHRCLDANLIEIPVEVKTPKHHYYQVALFTKRKVDAMEELTWDYGINFDDHGKPIKVFSCRCGSGFCRNMERPNSTRSVLHQSSNELL